MTSSALGVWTLSPVDGSMMVEPNAISFRLVVISWIVDWARKVSF